MIRLISDDELEVVASILLRDYAKAWKSCLALDFQLEQLSLPVEKIEFLHPPDDWRFWQEVTANFQFNKIVADIDSAESLRRLAVLLYHLLTGESEYNKTCYKLDNYVKPASSIYWEWLEPILNRRLRNFPSAESHFLKIRKARAQKEKELRLLAEKNSIEESFQSRLLKTDSLVSEKRTGILLDLLEENAFPVFRATDIKTACESLLLKLPAMKKLRKENSSLFHIKVASMFNQSLRGIPVIRYTGETLYRAWQENFRGEAEWALIYYFEWRWTVLETMNSFLTIPEVLLLEKEALPCGYYLVNLRPVKAGLTWSKQAEQLRKEEKYRLSEKAVAEFLITQRLLGRKNFLHKIGHFGPNQVCLKVFRFGRLKLQWVIPEKPKPNRHETVQKETKFSYVFRYGLKLKYLPRGTIVFSEKKSVYSSPNLGVIEYLPFD